MIAQRDMPSAQTIAEALGGARRLPGYWMARCPSHEDNKASLAIKDAPDGPLWKCHAGCDQRVVTQALRDRNIIPERTVARPTVRVVSAPRPVPTARIVQTYDYCEPSGALAFQSVRMDPKRFFQRHRGPDGQWVNNLDGVQLVPYRLPELLASTGTVYVVEGEKDVEALRSWGLTATCNPMGAGKWLPGFSDHLKERDVVILPDNDEPGRRHAESIVDMLQGIATSIRVVELPGLPDKGDVSDWIAGGGTVDDLQAMAFSAPPRIIEVAVAPRAFATTDLGNAERLVADHGDDLRWVPDWKTWLVWNGRYWERDTNGAVNRLMHDVVRKMGAGAADDEEAKHARRSESLQRLNAAIEVAKSLPGVTMRSELLDRRPDILVVHEGTVDLVSGNVGPHLRADYVTTVIRWDGELARYDARANCPTWLSSLERWQPDGEVRAYLQMLAGYSATGHVRERMMAIFWGVGRNGKSTFVEALRSTLGDHAHQAATDLVMQRKSGGDAGQATPELAVLQGKRLVVMDETSEGGRLDEARVKWITGGDSISARRLYGDPFSFRPSHTIILTTNHRPVIRSGGEAIWDRIQQVPWEVRIDEGDIDRTLPERLLDERPGILVWLVMGAVMWHQFGLNPPKPVKNATDEYRSSSDWFGLWLEDRCVVRDGEITPAADLHRAYNIWAKDIDERLLSIVSLGRILRERGFTATRDSRGRRAWSGIGLQAHALFPTSDLTDLTD